MLDSFDAVVSTLTSQLQAPLSRPLPGQDGQLKMAPRYRSNPSQLSIENKNCREAGVLILVLPIEGIPSVLLTVRKANLTTHAGQVSLPGGRRENGEQLVETAIRECTEEVSVPGSSIGIIGALTPLFIPPSGYCVHPYVGFAKNAVPVPDNREVERIVYAPVRTLTLADSRQIGTRAVGEREFDVPYYAIDGEMVWGATAMILSEFATVLERSDLPSGH